MHNQILNILKKRESLKFNSILNELGLENSDRKVLRSSLENLISDGKILKSGKYYSSLLKSVSLEGIVEFNPKGGYEVRFVSENSEVKTIPLKLKEGQIVATGDKIEFRISTKKEKEFGRLLNIISDDKKIVTGKFDKNKYFNLVIPDSKFVKKDIYINTKFVNGAKKGDKVLCEITNFSKYIDGDADPEGKIIKVIGKSGDTNVETEAILLKYDFKKEYPFEYKDTDKINLNTELKYRLDLRDKICFTVDPFDSKDFDDAVSIEKNEKGEFIIGVHIADVSHYVQENSEVDKEALKRGTSVYLPGEVIPMLPEKLSNNLCSLIPNEDRLTFSVFITLNNKYAVKDYFITKSIIKSKKRFTYEEVQKIIDNKKGEFSKEILLLYRVSKRLTAIRIENESLDFDTPEIKIVLDNKKRVKDVIVKERLDSMRLIEEFMLLANKCVTEFTNKLSHEYKITFPFIYRNHDLPDKEKLKELTEFIVQFGYRINLTDKKQIKYLLNKIKGSAEEYIINNLLLRSMAKAIYSEKNIGHYGLGFENYTHFTSPIRRYPDLIVHRMLFDYLAFSKNSSTVRREELMNKINHYNKILKDVCKQCSVNEQNAVYAERESTKLRQIEFLKDKVGNEYDGVISGIVKYGMFIEILDYMIEGMVRFRDIEGDYYEFDEKNHRAVGVRKGKIFHSGQVVRIKLISVNIENRRIDFTLVKH